MHMICWLVQLISTLKHGDYFLWFFLCEKNLRISLSDAEKFIIRDNGKEKQYGFDLLQSLHKAKRSDGLLKGYKVHVTKSVKPAPPQMQGNDKLYISFVYISILFFS